VKKSDYVPPCKNAIPDPHLGLERIMCQANEGCVCGFTKYCGIYNHRILLSNAVSCLRFVANTR